LKGQQAFCEGARLKLPPPNSYITGKMHAPSQSVLSTQWSRKTVTKPQALFGRKAASVAVVEKPKTVKGKTKNSVVEKSTEKPV